MIRFLVALGLLFGGVVQAAETPSISITGTGTVTATPDEGYISLGVVAYAEKSSDAVKQMTTAMTALYETLASLKIDKKDIQTVDLSVQERHKPKEKTTDFQASNIIQVKIRDLSQFGKVLDAVTSANKIYGISFGTCKSEEKLQEARKLAVADALSRAKSLASGLECQLGRVLEATDSTSSYRPRNSYVSMGGTERTDVPVSGGTLTFSASATVKWEVIPIRSGVKELPPTRVPNPRLIEPKPTDGKQLK